MRNLATLATAALIAVGLAGTAVARPPTVVLTGGGIVKNTDSGNVETIMDRLRKLAWTEISSKILNNAFSFA